MRVRVRVRGARTGRCGATRNILPAATAATAAARLETKAKAQRKCLSKDLARTRSRFRGCVMITHGLGFRV